MVTAGASWKETQSLLLHDSGGTGLSDHYTDRVFGRQKYVSWRSISSLLTLYLGDKVNVFKTVLLIVSCTWHDLPVSLLYGLYVWES